LKEPAILVTHPPDAEEAFLNGVPVGGGGHVGAYFVTTGHGAPQVFRIPSEALRAGANELTMKVVLKDENPYLLDGSIRLGEFDRISLEAEQLLDPVFTAEGAFLALFLPFLSLYLFLILKGVIRSDYVLFLVFLAAYAGRYLLDGNYVYMLGIVGPSLEHAQTVLASTAVLAMLGLVTKAAGGGFGITFKLLAGVGVVFLALDVVLSPLAALRFLSVPRSVYFGMLSGYYIFVAGRAVYRRREDSWPLLVGVLVYAIGSRVDLYAGFDMAEYSMGGFGLCMLFMLISHHARLQKRLLDVSGKLLDAHETERSRIARDIHDGIGQSLLAHKMHLELLAIDKEGGTPIPPVQLTELIRESADIIEDVRRSTMDLRPSFVESMGFIDAMRWYANIFGKKESFEIHFHESTEALPDFPPRVKDSLYRCFQEILTNAVKHSEASRVDVSLEGSGKSLTLRVTDNGKGIELPGKETAGIGLETLRERAELLGGACEIKGNPGIGTAVTITVPLS
jgi:signal transduction histidine kinase